MGWSELSHNFGCRRYSYGQTDLQIKNDCTGHLRSPPYIIPSVHVKQYVERSLLASQLDTQSHSRECLCSAPRNFPKSSPHQPTVLGLALRKKSKVYCQCPQVWHSSSPDPSLACTTPTCLRQRAVGGRFNLATGVTGCSRFHLLPGGPEASPNNSSCAVAHLQISTRPGCAIGNHCEPAEDHTPSP